MSAKRRTDSKKGKRDPFAVIVGGSLLVIVILVALVFIRGPHIREVTFSPELTTQNTGEWLLMHTNVPLRPVHSSQIRVMPSTSTHVLSSGNEVAIQFLRRLPYNTNYAVTLASSPLKLTYRFTTPKGVCYYLVSPGTIKEHVVGTSPDRTVYEAPFINEFALTGNYLAVVTQQSATDGLVIVNLSSGQTFDAKLPEAGTIQQLEASPDGQDFSYTFTSLNSAARPYYDSTLFSLNVPSNKSTPIYGFNHGLLRATAWAYSPSGLVMIVQTFSSVIEAVYVNGVTPPLPIGAYDIIDGFSSDGNDIYVGTSQKGFGVINVNTRTVTFLNQSPLGLGSTLELVDPLPNGNGYITQIQKEIPGVANYAEYVMLVQNGRQHVLFASPNGTDAIVGVSVSPNDQYVAIGVSPTYFTKSNGGLPASTLIVSLNGHVVDRIPSLEQVVWQ